MSIYDSLMAMQKQFNDLRAQFNDIARVDRPSPIEYAWTNYTPTLTWGGGTTNPTTVSFDFAKHLSLGKMTICLVSISIDTLGSGDRVYVDIPLPVNAGSSFIPAVAQENITSVGGSSPRATSLGGGTYVRIYHGTMTRTGHVSMSIIYYT